MQNSPANCASLSATCKAARKRGSRALFALNREPYREPPERLLARCYVGGAGRESILELDDKALIARVRAELREICGLTAEPTYVEVNRLMKAMPQYLL